MGAQAPGFIPIRHRFTSLYLGRDLGNLQQPDKIAMMRGGENSMPIRRRASLALMLFAASLCANGAQASPAANPLRFFEGGTESVSDVKVLMKKPFRSRSTGRGEIRPDGSLSLIQRVEEDGKAFERRWLIRQVAPARYSGTMTDAKGPITVELVKGRYRFTFKTVKNLSVEQWLTPLPGGREARTNATIRRLGVTVARSEGLIRKVSD